MGARTENALLPPESARAIYDTIERQGEAIRQEMTSASEHQNTKLDRILDAVDRVQTQLNDGRVQFERHDGQIKLLGNDLVHVDRRVTDVKKQVDDVESDFNKLYPAAVRKSPTDLHPALTKTPQGQRVIGGTGDVQKRLFFINPKLVLAFWIAAATVVGTAFGGWVVQRLTLGKITEVLQASADAKADADLNARMPSAKPIPPPPTTTP